MVGEEMMNMYMQVGGEFHGGKERWLLFSYWSRRLWWIYRNWPVQLLDYLQPCSHASMWAKEKSTHFGEEALGNLWLAWRNRESDREGASKGESNKKVIGHWWPKTHFTVFSGATLALGMDVSLTVQGSGQGVESDSICPHLVPVGRGWQVIILIFSKESVSPLLDGSGPWLLQITIIL